MGRIKDFLFRNMMKPDTSTDSPSDPRESLLEPLRSAVNTLQRYERDSEPEQEGSAARMSGESAQPTTPRENAAPMAEPVVKEIAPRTHEQRTAPSASPEQRPAQSAAVQAASEPSKEQSSGQDQQQGDAHQNKNQSTQTAQAEQPNTAQPFTLPTQTDTARYVADANLPMLYRYAVLERIEQEVSRFRSGGEEKTQWAKFEMNSDRLGKVETSIESSGKNLKVTVQTENADRLPLVREQYEGLREHLRDLGYENVQLEFRQQNQQQQAQQQRRQNADRQQQEGHRHQRGAEPEAQPQPVRQPRLYGYNTVEYVV